MRHGLGARRAAVVVGREAELDALERALKAATDGGASCIVVRGEGGVGKTRLLHEAAASARRTGVAVLAGRAPIISPPAFSVISEALRSWLRGHELPPLRSPYEQGLQLVLPERIDERAAAASLDMSPSQLQLLALEGIIELVREIVAASGAAVVLLDDLHAADPETLEAVRYLASASIEGTVVVAALRPGEGRLSDELVRLLDRDGVADVIDLSPLDERAVSDLLAALIDAEPPAPLVTDVMSRTDGVPLLVEEVLDAYVRAGSVSLDASGAVWRGGAITVPRTVREMVQARLDRLTRHERDVIVASAVTRSFDDAFLDAVAGVDAAAVHDALSAGIDVGLLETSSGAIGFRHAVIRDAVVDIAPPHVIERAHRRAVSTLATASTDDPQLLERRAGHLLAIGAADDAAAMLSEAARALLAEHALLGAEHLARTAFGVGTDAPTQAGASDVLAQVLAAQGRWADALAIDRATVAEFGETSDRRHRMALCALEAGQPELALPIVERALADGDTSPRMQIAAGRAALVAGDACRALECAGRIPADDLDATLERVGAPRARLRFPRRTREGSAGVDGPGRAGCGGRTDAGAATRGRAARQSRSLRR